MMNIIKIAGLLAIAFGTTACGVASAPPDDNLVSQRPIVAADPVSQKFDLPYEEVSQLDISPTGAAEILALSNGVEKAQAPLVSRNTPAADDILIGAAGAVGYNITQVHVEVPAELTVSEANRFLPGSDIVWREDPIGDRKAQVKVILENAIKTGASRMQGGRDVIMSVRLRTFHALTEKARYMTGGNHDIEFDYVLFDAKSGEAVTEVTRIDTKLKAYGGKKAFEAERRGETQKVRISAHVANVIHESLSATSQI